MLLLSGHEKVLESKCTFYFEDSSASPESKFSLALPDASPPSVPLGCAPEDTVPRSFHPNAGPDQDSDAHLGPCWLDEIKPPGDVREDGGGGEAWRV